ncbi:E3 ubiquitin ligase RNF157 isoform X3 [Ursus americanus]|uniref:E3 ubiquitin ligase RNF157 isoform X3 n=1 Tax=Ursus americanus TaxID=9643 RepID=UPI001E67A4D2|nr:E3 ubiquitin ligase RNF157 isoform X3 [Ursus americanus]
MGALTSRQHAGVEEVDIPSNSVYRYPPKSGSYFASHFIMGGEKFDSTHPEGYLFGENSDLNFLGNRPVTFPYAAPPPQEPVKTLRSLVNIRKDTLRLVKCAEEVKTPGEEAGRAKVHYNVEFTFDTDARVAITIYYQATEEFQNGIASYIPKDNSLQSETVHYKRGVCQQFCLPSHTVDPSEWAEEELGFDLDREVYPLVVHAVVDEGDEYFGHCHVLLGTFEKHTDGTFCVKPLKQKQVVDGVSYLLQEIYGIENKYNTQDSKVAEDEVSDNSAECVVCLSDVRDTLILPCRHLCLCNTCADTLRYQANNCPICRLPFRALLQIRAMRKKLGPLSPTSFNPIISSQTSDSEEHSSSENIPPGYEVVSLLEALNGPLTPSPAVPALHVLGDGHLSGMLPSYGSDGHLPPVRTLSPLDRLSDCSSQGIKLKKSLSKSVSQNSSVLHEEEDERSCSDSETQLSQRPSAQHLEEECGVTPESENLTLSSSGAIDQSSCTGTPLSSTISSPEGTRGSGSNCTFFFSAQSSALLTAPPEGLRAGRLIPKLHENQAPLRGRGVLLTAAGRAHLTPGPAIMGSLNAESGTSGSLLPGLSSELENVKEQNLGTPETYTFVGKGVARPPWSPTGRASTGRPLGSSVSNQKPCLTSSLLPSTPVSTDPASSSLAQSVMSMVSSQSQHSQISTDTVSSMSGSYIAPGTEEEGEALPSPRAASGAPSEEGEVMPSSSPDSNFVGLAAEEQDAEGNDVIEEEDGSPTQEDGTWQADDNVVSRRNTQRRRLSSGSLDDPEDRPCVWGPLAV